VRMLEGLIVVLVRVVLVMSLSPLGVVV